MSLLNTFKNAAATKALEGLKEKVLNPGFARFGQISRIAYENKRLTLGLLLKGLEDREIEVSCAGIRIADDGSSVTLYDYTSNVEFVTEAMNMFATRPIDVPDNSMVRSVVKTAKTVLGL